MNTTHPAAFFASTDSSFIDAVQECALARAAQQGCTGSRDQLIRSHIKLVCRIAREHGRFGVDVEDLVAEGLVGLTVAATRFDPARGVRFASYAAFWIRGYIRRYTLDNRRMVRLPETRAGRRVLAQLRSTERRLTSENGSPPSDEELARALEVSEADVLATRNALQSRDAALDAGGAVPVESSPLPEERVADAEIEAQRRKQLDHALETLTDRERTIVDRRLLANEPSTLAALGSDLGVSRERVRQLEARVLDKLRIALNAA